MFLDTDSTRIYCTCIIVKTYCTNIKATKLKNNIIGNNKTNQAILEAPALHIKFNIHVQNRI
jgi:hypothetical protein